jgi:hypothetical protein
VLVVRGISVFDTICCDVVFEGSNISGARFLLGTGFLSSFAGGTDFFGAVLF